VSALYPASHAKNPNPPASAPQDREGIAKAMWQGTLMVMLPYWSVSRVRENASCSMYEQNDHRLSNYDVDGDAAILELIQGAYECLLQHV